MAPRGALKPREPGSLKDAVARLVGLVGGQREAARDARVSPSQMQRYTDDSDAHSTTHAPVDIVVALELRAGDPVVTRCMAQRQGYILLHVGRDHAAVPICDAMAELAKDSGDMLHDALKAFARGRFDPGRGERRKLRHAAILHLKHVAEFLDALNGDGG